MTNDDVIQQLAACWQDHDVRIEQPSARDIRRRAAQFQRQTRLWNIAAYASGIISLAVYGRMRMMPGSFAHGAGLTLIFASVLYSLDQVRKGRGARSVPALGTNACVEFHRAEITRQRDFLLRSWRYLLLPIPGFVILQLDSPDRTPWLTPSQRAMPLAIVALLFTLVTLARRRQARTLQRELDSLSATIME